MELDPLGAGHVDVETGARILLFDWWVRNTDRRLGRRSGNPNVLWLPKEKEVRMIDHEQAFDPHFDRQAIFREHVSLAQGRRLGAEDRLAMADEFAKIRPLLADFCAELPDPWLYLDDEKSVRSDFAPEVLGGMLDVALNGAEGRGGVSLHEERGEGSPDLALEGAAGGGAHPGRLPGLLSVGLPEEAAGA